MNEIKPILTLNMNDKIYLAVARDTTSEKLAFVYTLACLKDKPGARDYNLYADREIHVFTDKQDAQIYHDAIEQVVDINSEDKMLKGLFTANEKYIQTFYDIHTNKK